MKESNASNRPKTISELQDWFKANGFDYNKTRFFIGIDFKDPKAFGIYKDDFGEFVVYKNKADGTRAIRYHGSDEEYAVNEIWERFQKEIINQKTRWAEDQRKAKGTDSKTPEQLKKESFTLFLLIAVTFLPSLLIPIALDSIFNLHLGLLLVAFPMIITIWASYFYYLHTKGLKVKDDYNTGFKPLLKGCIIGLAICLLINGIVAFAGRKNGYYSINNELYYRADDVWYHYENNGGSYTWQVENNIPSDLTASNWNNYNNVDNYNYSYTRFETTSYYDAWKSDGDSDWSSDDWDSGYTDWNSDW